MSDSLTLKVETPTRLKEAGYGRARLDPVAYADLIMNGDPVKYLKTVTVYKPFEN